jgi:DNA-binding MarR family transcriptional regulator
MSSTSKKDQLMQALNIQVRYISANSVMFSQIVAAKVGIHPTDNECLDFLLLNGPATAGQISAFAGLTTGAVTAMLDRLEKSGYVRREHDQQDRRRVIVIPNEAKIMADIMPHTMPMGEALNAICAEFSEAELETILSFILKANQAAADVIARSRG